MLTAFLILVALGGGVAATYFILDGPRRRHVKALRDLVGREDDFREERRRERQRQADAGQSLADRERRLEDAQRHARDRAAHLGQREEAFKQAQAEGERRLQAEAKRGHDALDARTLTVQQAEAAHQRKVVAYHDLQGENSLLKAELRHQLIAAAKLEFDRDLQARTQTRLDGLVEALGREHLKQTQEWIAKSLTANNYTPCRERLQTAIDRVTTLGVTVPDAARKALHDELQESYKVAVRKALAREDQAKVQKQLREEAQQEKEAQEALERAQRAQQVLENALAKALADTHDRHAGEVARLQAELDDARRKTEHAVSNARITRVGHVYVISNIGAFGENVYKIGVTRRTEPQDRIDELSSASVPFPFDVHMMISCQDAPALERGLHHAFHRRRLNKANPRKEFFEVTLAEIAREVEARHGKVEYTIEPEAKEYYAGLTMSDADQDFVEEAFGEEVTAVVADEA